MPMNKNRSENIVQTNQLTKVIDGKELVKEVNIHVKKGEIYGFLGPNGAGKTTVMKMLTNLWKPTFGTVELFGETLTPTSYEVLKRMGSIIEFPCFYEHMSGRRTCSCTASTWAIMCLTVWITHWKCLGCRAWETSW